MTRYLKKKNTFTVTLFREARKLPEAWDHILPEAHFLRKDQLLTDELCRLPDLRPVYAFICKANQPVALAFFQVLSIGKKHLNTQNASRLQRQAWHVFTSMLSPKLLVAGHLFRHDITSFYYRSDLSAFDAFQIYHDAISRTTRSVCASAVLIKDLNESLIPCFRHFAPEYLLLRNDISMEMNLPEEWKTTRDYEQQLKHKYAQRFRKIRQSWEELEVCELTAAATEQHKTVLYRLYEQVSLRQQVRLGVLSEDFLPVLKSANPDLHIWLIRHNGEAVAFFSAWTQPDVFDMFYIGIDYSRNESLQLYFNILFFSVEQAILLNKKKLVLGRTALEAKARLGCKPRYLSTYLYVRNGLLRKIIGRMQQGIGNQEGEWENRHPFKR